MKTFVRLLALLTLTTLASLAAPNGRPSDFDDTSRFIFYSVLEGCYEDGLSNKDTDQVLMRKEGQSYFHFIYACPVCTATIWAFETYRKRPDEFYSLKSSASTFGPGLPDAAEKQLFSEDPRQRLAAINLLVKKWIERRMADQHLNAGQRKILEAGLEEKRQQGMNYLKDFRKSGDQLNSYAPAYIDLDECAVCNGAVGKLMNLPSDKSKPAGK